jgi:hypothetical protein
MFAPVLSGMVAVGGRNAVVGSRERDGGLGGGAGNGGSHGRGRRGCGWRRRCGSGRLWARVIGGGGLQLLGGVGHQPLRICQWHSRLGWRCFFLGTARWSNHSAAAYKSQTNQVHSSILCTLHTVDLNLLPARILVLSLAVALALVPEQVQAPACVQGLRPMLLVLPLWAALAPELAVPQAAEWGPASISSIEKIMKAQVAAERNRLCHPHCMRHQTRCSTSLPCLMLRRHGACPGGCDVSEQRKLQKGAWHTHLVMDGRSGWGKGGLSEA